jgi:hypothetical protein
MFSTCPSESWHLLRHRWQATPLFVFGGCSGGLKDCLDFRCASWIMGSAFWKSRRIQSARKLVDLEIRVDFLPQWL